MGPKLDRLWRIFKLVVSRWQKHNTPRMGAALAYYSVFSLGPLFLIAVSVAGTVFGKTAAREELSKYLLATFGVYGADVVEGLIEKAYGETAEGLAAMTGIFVLSLAALKVVIELKESLNQIWEVPPKPVSGFRRFIRKYIVSFAAVIGIGFLLLVSLIFSAFLAALGGYVETFFALSQPFLQVINFGISFVGITLFFSWLFKILPDTPVQWKDVWVGAVLTAILFILGKTLIGLYLGGLSLESTYGAAASIVLILLWVYYSAQIVFLGAEFSRVYAEEWGSRAKKVARSHQEPKAQTAR